MQIRIRESSAVMYIDEFRRLNAGTSFPQVISEETLNDFGADIVFEGPQASGGDHYQYSQAAGVEQIDGKWYTKYILGPVFTDTPEIEISETETQPAKTAAENEAAYKATKDAEQAKGIRTTRNDMLKESDWTHTTDSTVANKQAWATYRQALRDITSQVGFPWTITWPVVPQ